MILMVHSDWLVRKGPKSGLTLAEINLEIVTYLTKYLSYFVKFMGGAALTLSPAVPRDSVKLGSAVHAVMQLPRHSDDASEQKEDTTPPLEPSCSRRNDDRNQTVEHEAEGPSTSVLV